MVNRGTFDNARRALSTAHERRTSLCAPFLAVLPVAGASVSVLSSPVGQSTVCSTDAIAERLDELQFDLGEGPCWQAMATRAPVLASDLRTANNSAWPTFAEAIRHDQRAHEVAAMYAFPLVVGSLDIGAVDLYALQPGELNSEQVSDAATLASIAAWQVLRRVLGDQASELDNGPSSRREVHQATGMVLAQLNVSAEDAALLVKAHAFASGRSVRDVATDIVARNLDFTTHDGDSGVRDKV